MYLSRFLSIHALWVTVSSVMQTYPLVWGHYDVCETQIYTEEGKVQDYMACQSESTDMTKYLKVKLDPLDIACGDPPESFCAMVCPLKLICWFVDKNHLHQMHLVESLPTDDKGSPQQVLFGLILVCFLL